MDSIKSPSPPTFTTPSPQPVSSGDGGGIFSNIFYILLIVILVLSIFTFLGLNLLNIAGNVNENAVRIFGPTLEKVLKNLGYSSGELLNESSEVAADVIKTGVDVADGTLHNVGNLLNGGPNSDHRNYNRKSHDSEKYHHHDRDHVEKQITNKKDSKPHHHTQSKLDTSINKSKIDKHDPKPDSGASMIQKPISSKKSNWCLVGEHNRKRGCIEIGDHDKCMSGQVFPSQKMCLNPNFTKNPKP